MCRHFQMHFPADFSFILIEISLKFVSRVQVATNQYRATSPHFNHWWPVHWCIYAALGISFSIFLTNKALISFKMSSIILWYSVQYYDMLYLKLCIETILLRGISPNKQDVYLTQCHCFPPQLPILFTSHTPCCWTTEQSCPDGHRTVNGIC